MLWLALSRCQSPRALTLNLTVTIAYNSIYGILYSFLWHIIVCYTIFRYIIVYSSIFVIYLSVYLSIYLSICIYMYIYIYQSYITTSLSLYVYMYICRVQYISYALEAMVSSTVQKPLPGPEREAAKRLPGFGFRTPWDEMDGSGSRTQRFEGFTALDSRASGPFLTFKYAFRGFGFASGYQGFETLRLGRFNLTITVAKAAITTITSSHDHHHQHHQYRTTGFASIQYYVRLHCVGKMRCCHLHRSRHLASPQLE